MATTAVRGQKLANELAKMADRLEGKFRNAFLRSMIAMAEDPELKKLLRDIQAGRFTYGDPIDARLNAVRLNLAEMNEVARQAIANSAKVTKDVMNLKGSFDVVNDAVIDAARNLSVDLSTYLRKSTKESLRQVVEDLISGNINEAEAIRRIKLEVGLLPQHTKAVNNYRKTLINAGTPRGKANQLAEQYAKRLLKYRANMIARTEVARATGIGQTQFWRQMRDQGSLPPQANRVWITAMDERACSFCLSMNGQVASIDGGWETVNGYMEYPQASHPHCRCSSGVTTRRMTKTGREGAIAKVEELEFDRWVSKHLGGQHDQQNHAGSAGSGWFSGGRELTNDEFAARQKETAESNARLLQNAKTRMAQRRNRPSEKKVVGADGYEYDPELIKEIGTYTLNGVWGGKLIATVESAPQTSSKPLHRGMTMGEKEFSELVDSVKVGRSIRAGGSWTESLDVAKEFASEESPAMSQGEYSVVITVKGGARGLHVAPFATEEFAYQKEWLIPNGRKMRVTSVKKRGKRLTVEVEQSSRVSKHLSGQHDQQSHAGGAVGSKGLTVSEYRKFSDETWQYTENWPVGVRNYLGYGYSKVNIHLRETKGRPVNYDARLAVDDVVNYSLPMPRNATLYRGAHLPSPPTFNVGDIIQNDSFTSTSTNRKIANGFAIDRDQFGVAPVASDRVPVVYKIAVPKGTYVLPMGSNESEILMPPTAQMRVVAVRRLEKPLDYGDGKRTGVHYEVEVEMVGYERKYKFSEPRQPEVEVDEVSAPPSSGGVTISLPPENAVTVLEAPID